MRAATNPAGSAAPPRATVDWALGLALVGPTLLLAGALGMQHLGGLPPCEMCMWQRWPHLAAIALGLVALAMAGGARRVLTALAGMAVLASAAVAGFHVGVEQHLWQGPTQCASTGDLGSGADFAASMIAAPLVRCDVVPWSLFGVSLAGWNLLFSLLIGGAVLWLTLARR